MCLGRGLLGLLGGQWVALWGSWGPLLGPLGSSQWPLAALSGGLRLLLGRSCGTLLTHSGSFFASPGCSRGALLVLFGCSGWPFGSPLVFFQGSQNALLAVPETTTGATGYQSITFFFVFSCGAAPSIMGCTVSGACFCCAES